MNCQIIQRRLLGVEDPECLPAEVQAHLDGCAACREWQARLVQLEANVRRLPVPASRARAAFVRQLFETEAAPSDSTPVPAVNPSLPHEPRPRRVIRRIPAPVASNSGVAVPWRYAAPAAAAAVLLFVLAWSSVRESGVDRPVAERSKHDVLVANLVKHDLALAEAKDRGQRSATLKKIDDELLREQQALNGDGETNELIKDVDTWRTNVADTIAAISGRPAANVMTSITVAPKADPGRVEQLRRNWGLVRTLVEAGLRLAREEDFLKRIECCRDLAGELAVEIRAAATRRDSGRALEMSDRFSDLCSGVAINLVAYGTEARPDSAANEGVKRVGGQVTAMTADLEQALADRNATNGVSPDDMAKVLDAIRKGRDRVKQAAGLS